MQPSATEQVERFHEVAATPPRKTAAQSAEDICNLEDFLKAATASGQSLGEFRFYQRRAANLRSLSRDFRIEVRPGITADALSEAEINDHTPAGHQRVLDILETFRPHANTTEEIFALANIIANETAALRNAQNAAVLHDVNFGGVDA